MAGILKYKAAGIGLILTILLAGATAHAQVGGVEGKVTGEDGKPLAGYNIQVDRMEGFKWSSHVKTNKKGEFAYIGLQAGHYRLTLMDSDNKPMHSEDTQVKTGDPVEVNFDLVKVHTDAVKAAEANPEYQKQVEAQKESASLKQQFDQGQQLFNDKKYTDAAAAYEKALPLAKDRNVPIVLNRLAVTWESAGDAETDPDKRKEDYANSMDYYNKILAIAPREAIVHNNLGHLYADMGKTDEALAEFQKAADIDPTHAASYYYNLGIIEVNKGKMDDASTALKKSTDLDPNNAVAWYWYGMALMGKATVKPDGSMAPFPGTIEAFQTYLKLDPKGNHAAEAQASIDALSAKANLEYKKNKK
jgi:tetratricopeptide (TPR) repeat protein